MFKEKIIAKIIENKVLATIIAIVVIGAVAGVGILLVGNDKQGDNSVNNSENVLETEFNTNENETNSEFVTEMESEMGAETEIEVETEVEAGNEIETEIQTDTNTQENLDSSVSEEVSKEELLLSYYRNTIQGTAPMLESKNVTFVNTWTLELPAGNNNGIATYNVLDLDCDGEAELLVVYSDEEYYTMAVYEVENNTVVKKSEKKIGEVAYWISDGTNDVSLVTAGTTNYILYTRHLWGVISDGYSAAVNMWRYDGANILQVMDIEQTSGGTCEFEFTTYHYNPSGNVTEEVVIYREFEDVILDKDGSLMASQFARYGIQVHVEESMFSKLETIVADTMKRKVLYRENRNGECEYIDQEETVEITFERIRE